MLAVSKTTSIFKPAKFLHIRAGGHNWLVVGGEYVVGIN